MANNTKLTIKEKAGYGAASMGDSIAYTMVGSFLLFFLTTVAGIKPALSGTILAIGAIWNAVYNPIIGYFADKLSTKYGRRRPLILIFSIPLGLSLFLIFTNVSLTPSAKAIYYGILLMLLWTSYTSFFVPYLALGAEYTTDYDDRTKLRLMASLFNCLGSTISMTFPSGLVSILTKHGFSISQAWSVLGAIVGSITTISIIITVILSKKKDPPCADTGFYFNNNPDELNTKKKNPHQFKFSVIDIFKEYFDVAMLKPMKYLVAASTFSLITYTIVMSDMVYFMTYNMNASPAVISATLVARALAGIALIPLCGKIAIAIDKRQTIILFYLIAFAGMVFLRFTYIDFSWRIVLYVLMACLCTTIYWHLMPSIYYDVCDYDFYYNKKNRQATIVSFQGLVEAAATGIGSLILGVILQSSGFNGKTDVQNQLTLHWILNCTTLVPVFFLLLAGIAIYKYPITREAHKKLQEGK